MHSPEHMRWLLHSSFFSSLLALSEGYSGANGLDAGSIMAYDVDDGSEGAINDPSTFIILSYDCGCAPISCMSYSNSGETFRSVFIGANESFGMSPSTSPATLVMAGSMKMAVSFFG